MNSKFSEDMGTESYPKEKVYTGDKRVISSFNQEGVFSETERFLIDRRSSSETRYVISKANNTIKSSENYVNDKLHGESITYNTEGKIVTQEVYAWGDLVFKYIRNGLFDIIGIELIKKDKVEDLPQCELDLLQTFMKDKPEWFQ